MAGPARMNPEDMKHYLADLLRGAGIANTAGIFGLPVDIAMGMSPMSREQLEANMGGKMPMSSEWLTEKLRPYIGESESPAAEAVGGLLGGLVPTAKAAALGKAAAGLFAGGVGAMKGVGKGGKVVDAITKSAQLPDITTMPTEEAIKIARKQPHLIPSSESAEGAYVGGPREIQSKRGLTNLRKEFDAYVAADPRGADWYDRYRQGVKDVTGGNRKQADWMSAQEGQWSAGVSPESEIQFALKENNGSLAGMPVKSARPAQHQAHLRAIEMNDPSQYQLGEKTGEYARLVNPFQDRPAGATGVNDFRHARNWKYTETSGDAQRGGLGATQHKFLDYETALAVDRANTNALGGRTDWSGEKLQAAPWVRQKAMDIMERNPKLTYEEAFGEANKTIADFFAKHTAYATGEVQPGSATRHLPDSMNASQAERIEYAGDPRASFAKADGGRDLVYGGLQLGDTGVAARVLPSREMQGFYKNPEGVVETNPGEAHRLLVAFDQGEGNTKSLPKAEKALLDAGEMYRAYISAQNAGAAHKRWIGGLVGDTNGYAIPMEGKSNPEQMLAVKGVTDRYGMPDVVDTGGGLTLANFGGSGGAAVGPLQPGAQRLPDMADRKVVKGLLGELDKVLPGAQPERSKIDAAYQDLTSQWREPEGSGAATRAMLEQINQTPEIRSAFNNNPHIPKDALERMALDQDWAGKWGAPRGDIQNARSIIGQGAGWVDRLEEALKRRAYLPAGLFGLPAAGMLSDPESAPY